MAPTTRRKNHLNEDRHLENPDKGKDDIAKTQKTRVSTRKMQRTGLSFCRPTRDYTRSVKWSGAMNKEIYRLYVSSKPKDKGYQQRLKQLFDENYPEFDQMSGKHLAQQIRNIKTKKLITEYEIQLIENRIDSTSTSEIHHVQTELQELIEQVEQDPVIIQQQEHLDNEVEDSIDPGIKEYLSQRWKENFEKYVSKSVDDREYSTMISPPPSEKLLNAMDKIVEEQLEEIIDRYGNNLWTLNVLYYVTAITVIEKEGKLKSKRVFYS